MNQKGGILGSNYTTSDGMIFDQRGNLYLSDNEHDAIARVTPRMKLEIVAHDPAIDLAGHFAWSPDGSLYVTCSQIQNMPWCHDGKVHARRLITIYRLKWNEHAGDTIKFTSGRSGWMYKEWADDFYRGPQTN